jgi:hypothetical protein
VLRRSAYLSAIVLAVLAGAGACTRSFEQFESERYRPPSGSGGSGGVGGGEVSTTTTTTTTTSTGSGGEDCLNGADDDGDGDVDCADADCGRYACVEVPEGWRGPVVLYEGPESSTLACPDGFSGLEDVGGREVDAPATCSRCACGESDVACSPSPLIVYQGDACDGPRSPSVQLPGVCSPLAGGFEPRSYGAEAPSFDASPCAPSGGEPTGPLAVFQTQGRVCAIAMGGGGCTTGGVCAPGEISAPFQGTVCISSDGDQRCPGGFGDRHLFARGIMDERRCTPCTCGAPLVTCTATTTLYRDAFCTDDVEVVANDGLCAADAARAIALEVEVTAGGSCAPDGGQPTGSAVPDPRQQTTVCCAR